MESLCAGDFGSYNESYNGVEINMVRLKVRKFGNSLGVVLPREVVARLNTEEGAPLYLTEAPDGGYRLVAFDPQFDEKMSKAESIMRRYRDTLRTLAK
jgi:putative addiction module antidote